MDEKIWKDIPGYIGLYQISDLGNVKSLSYGCKINKNDMSKIFEMYGNNISLTNIANKFNITSTHIRRIIKNPDKFLNREKILKTYKEKSGYLLIHLFKNRKSKTYRIHELVLLTFIGVKPDSMECCHNDGNPGNNHISNLRYDTKRNNWNDSVLHGTRFQPDSKGSKSGKSRLDESQVQIIKNLLSNKLKIKEIAKTFCVSINTIYQIKYNKTWKHV